MRYYYIYVMLSLFFLSCNACTDRTISVVKPDKDDKNADLIDLNRQFAKAESRFMKYYIDSLGIKAIQAPMGYWYWIYENVDSEVSPESGDIVTLKYRVSLLEGGMLYSSAEKGLKSFKVDMSEVESGLHHGVKHLSVGDKAKFILPSHLAFGTYGDGEKIPSKATLLYDLELIEITKP